MQKGGSLFVFDNVKTKKTLEDSNKVSNVLNKTQKGESLFVIGNIKAKGKEDSGGFYITRSQMFPIRDAGGNLDIGKWINLHCVIKNWK